MRHCARTFITAGVSRYALIWLPRSHDDGLVAQLGSSLMTSTAVGWARRRRGSDGGGRGRRHVHAWARVVAWGGCRLRARDLTGREDKKTCVSTFVI